MSQVLNSPSSYKQLTQEQLDMIDAIREHGNNLGQAIEIFFVMPDLDKRWLSIAKTHFQEGLMAWVRAITKPEFF